MSGAAKKALVVDNDPATLRRTGVALSEAGYEVLNASNGVEGLRIARASKPHVLILDTLLPGVDGFEVCHRLRGEQGTQKTPILLLSAKARESDRTTGLRMGADDFMAKPADPVSLVERVGKLLIEKGLKSSMVIALVGCRGGVGTSTVAVNVAASIAQNGKEALLLDPCPKFDSIPTLLSLDKAQGVIKLFGPSEGTASHQGVVATMATHYSGLQVLFNLQPASKSKTLAHTEVETLLQEIRQAATYVFVDVSGKPAQVWQTSLRECTKAVLVTDSGADGLEHAKAMSTNLRSKAGKKIAGGLIVVDRDGTLAEIDMARMRPVVEAAVEMPLLEVIPHDLKVPLEFEARGLPVVLAEPGRPISKAFHQLAEKLIANGSIPQSSEGSDE